jgi:hypothetical protein
MKIAKIVGSNSHIAYFARVLDGRDTDAVPGADDYGFGKFVSITFDNETIVGVICDSRLVNPEYSNYAPRMNPTPALGELKRDLVDEQKALVGILLLGSVKDGKTEQDIPRRVVPSGQFVYTMEPEAIADFHRSGDGAIQMHYFSNLIAQSGSLAIPLAKTIIEQLNPHCSEFDRQRLAVMTSALTWKHTFGDLRI